MGSFCAVFGTSFAACVVDGFEASFLTVLASILAPFTDPVGILVGSIFVNILASFWYAFGLRLESEKRPNANPP